MFFLTCLMRHLRWLTAFGPFALAVFENESFTHDLPSSLYRLSSYLF
jgi:hypothetical protein